MFLPKNYTNHLHVQSTSTQQIDFVCFLISEYTLTIIDGWDDGDGNTVRGAYSNMFNPLNVPIRITSFEGIGYIPNPFSYTAKLALLLSYPCAETDVYAYLRIGQGMYKQDSSKTWVDIDANSRGTFYTIVESDFHQHSLHQP